MPRERMRDYDRETRLTHEARLLGNPGVTGRAKIGGAGRASGVVAASPVAIPAARGTSIQHVTLLATASQTIASGGASLGFDRIAGAPTEIRGFPTLLDNIATGEVFAIPVDVTGVLNGILVGLYSDYRQGGTITVTRTRHGQPVDLDLDDDVATSRRFVVVLDGVEVQAGDTITITIPNGTTGQATYSSASVSYSSSATGYSDGSAILASATLQLKVIALASPTSRTTATYRDVVMEDGPILYWRFEETSGTTAADESGNSRTGTYVGSPTLDVAGIDSSSAVQFSTVDDHVDGPSDSAVQFTGTSAFTVEAWVIPDEVPAGHVTVACFRDTGADAHTWWFGYASSGTAANRNAGTSTTGDVIGAAPTVGQWNHLVWTYDGATQRLYVNGSLVDSAADAGSVSAGAESLRFAARDAGGIGGVADEFALYDKALSATRIARHYNVGIGAAS